MPIRCSSRAGFTLVELLIALALALLIGGTTVTLLTRQQRFARDIHGVLSTRMHVRDATTILAAELRGASVRDSIRFASDTAVELVTIIGASVVCTNPNSTVLVLPPDTLSNGNTLTSFLYTPDSNDVISVFRDSSALSPTRTWLHFGIARVSRPTTSAACPPSSTFTTMNDVTTGHHAFSITLATPSPLPIPPGTPIRVLRRARYNLYRASDGFWYMGYRRCNTTGCVVVQPVSGPYTTTTGPALTFRYYAANGGEILSHTPTTAIARIDVVVRTATQSTVKLPGILDTLFTDSSVATIALRNAL